MKQKEYIPTALDFEELVLGAILIDKEGYDLINGTLTSNHFYKAEHSMIFSAIENLAKQNSKIDVSTVCQQLKKESKLEVVGGSYFVSSLMDRVASAYNIEEHSKHIVQTYLLRCMIDIGHSLINMAQEPSTDCFDLIEYGANTIQNLLTGLDKKEAKRLDKLKDEVIADNMNALINGVQNGIPISLTKLQSITFGWQKTDLIILAGRPGMGKTSVALEYAIYPAMQKIAVAFFSLEMSAKQLASKLMAKESGLQANEIAGSRLDTFKHDALKRNTEIFNGVPLFIDDTPSLTLNKLRSKARKLKREKEIKLIIIDYLQLMEGSDKNSNREQEVSKISRGLKALAKELDLPIIALSQLSRDAVKGGVVRKPQLSDLRDSGAIEQDADMVIFAHRPEYYGLTTHEYNGVEIPTNGLMLHIIAKNRHGEVCEFRNKWIAATTSIADYEDYQTENKPIQNNTNFLN